MGLESATLTHAARNLTQITKLPVLPQTGAFPISPFPEKWENVKIRDVYK